MRKNNPINLSDTCEKCVGRFSSLHDCMEICGVPLDILLDVENYKEKKLSNLERNAKRIAKEVLRTKIEVKLDDMNSYERRIIHNALSNFKNISTTSEGEEPNRHIVISYKED